VTGVAQELAQLPETTRRLLAVHVPDGRGRCQGCTTPGTGMPGAAWPCALHFYASAAQEIWRQSERSGRQPVTAAEQLGCSPRTGRQLLRQAEEHLAATTLPTSGAGGAKSVTRAAARDGMSSADEVQAI
jgi:hypothetical protein